MTDFSDEDLARWLEQQRCRATETFVTRQQLSVHLLKYTLKAIAQGLYTAPFVLDVARDSLLIRTEHMAGLQSPETEQRWGGRISGRGLMRELAQQGVIDVGPDGDPVRYEKTLNAKRVSHMVAIRLSSATELVFPGRGNADH